MGRLLIEFPYFCCRGVPLEAFGGRPCNYFEPGAPVGDERIVRKLAFFRRCGDPSRSEPPPSRSPSLLFPYRLVAAQSPFSSCEECRSRVKVVFLRIPARGLSEFNEP